MSITRRGFFRVVSGAVAAASLGRVRESKAGPGHRRVRLASPRNVTADSDFLLGGGMDEIRYFDPGDPRIEEHISRGWTRLGGDDGAR